ncbi:baseplate protein J [Myxacorys almedinensis]|uniref:Baseplate protein J n=1 Tax=Myxacorys almedinensis A TaxID=2690445 RepID=A0A8J8CHB4_9CYAN|nr:baseplate protein J [Myxacorys almedinensis]NDJ16459.1 baseplate protein J [Myxacorys almedinensis A]
MPLPLPNLDDHTYDDLIDQARSQIPLEFAEWTDHNATDPGIILLELLSWLTEMLLYRVNRVSDRNIEMFLKLLNGADWTLQGDLPTAIRETVQTLRQRHRAVTPEDYEQLALQDWSLTPAAQALGNAALIGQAKCLIHRNLATPDAAAKLDHAPGHVSLVIVPALFDDATPQPSASLQTALWQWLDQRRLLTTRHHVVGADYLPVQLSAAQLSLEEGAAIAAIREEATGRMRQFFHPLTGGPDGKGWQFGRDVYLSEVYEQLERLPGVHHVRGITLEAARDRIQHTDDGSLTSITLHAHELVAIDVQPARFTLIERLGGTWS